MTEQSVKQKAYTNINRRSRKRELGDVSKKFTWLSQPSSSSCKRPTAVADIVYFSVSMFEKKSFLGSWCSFLCHGPTSRKAPKGGFPLLRNFSVCTRIKFTFVKIEVMFERPRVYPKCLREVQILPVQATFHKLPQSYLRTESYIWNPP